MIGKEDVKKLASLSRITIDDTETQGLAKELESILKYIADIKGISKAPPQKEENIGLNYNVLRQDENPHESGMYTKEIVKEMPNTENGYLKVKKILG